MREFANALPEVLAAMAVNYSCSLSFRFKNFVDRIFHCRLPKMKYSIPESLETDRLFLRIFRSDDWKYIHQYFSDEECMKYTLGRLLTEGESWRTMSSLTGHWILRNYGPYALEYKSDSHVIGYAGLYYPNDWPEPEIAWGLLREYWGKGFASEAVRAIKKMKSQYLPDLSLISMIHPENINSIQLAKALGASFEREHDFRGSVMNIYRHSE
jgi:RimJ/RimL family protein N-acetyltransferase